MRRSEAGIALVVQALKKSRNATIVSVSECRVVYQVGKYDRFSIRPDERLGGFRYGKLVNGKLEGIKEFFCPGWEFPLRDAGVELEETGYRVELNDTYEKLTVAWKRPKRK